VNYHLCLCVCVKIVWEADNKRPFRVDDNCRDILKQPRKLMLMGADVRSSKRAEYMEKRVYKLSEQEIKQFEEEENDYKRVYIK
jgi:hypothetical protein